MAAVQDEDVERDGHDAASAHDKAGLLAGPAQERRARGAAISRRLHTNILPIFLLMATLCYLDRTNSAFAALQMTADLRFGPETYGLGSGLFFVGYSLAMIPSQFILMRVGAPRWLAVIVTTWGVTAMSFAFMRTKLQFFVLRLLLGMAESGAFPGAWCYLNSFYPPDLVTVPYSLIEAAVGVANVAGAPLAACLLMMDGLHGMHGWQWLFLLEGLPSVATGVAMAYVLPRDYQSSAFLSPADKAWLGQALAAQKKHAQEAEGQPFLALLWDAARNRRVLLAGLAALLKNAAVVGVLFWAPIIVASLLRGAPVDLGATAAAAATAAAPSAHGHHHLHHHHHSRHLLAAVATQQQQHQHQQGGWSRALLGANSSGGGDGVGAGGSAAAAAGAAALAQPVEAGRQVVAAAAAAAGKAAVGVAAAAAQHTTPSSSSSSGHGGGGGGGGSDRGVAAVLLTAVPFVCAASGAVWLGHRSQRRKEKCWHVAVPYFAAAALFVCFPSLASLSSAWAFLCLTAAITALTAPNAILNSLASSVSAGPSSAVSLALYNAVGNPGGLLGPWMIGRVVAATGLYASALQALGLMVAAAGGIAVYMRRWNVA